MLLAYLFALNAEGGGTLCRLWWEDERVEVGVLGGRLELSDCGIRAWSVRCVRRDDRETLSPANRDVSVLIDESLDFLDSIRGSLNTELPDAAENTLDVSL